MEHKFKVGDYVVVKQDAKSPVYQDKPLTNWAASLTPGSIHEVKKIGTYKWTKEVNCIVIRELGFYTPEDCFELFSPKHFVAGSYVKCTRLPEDIDWEITNCGKVQSLQDKLTVGETYKVDNVSSTGNLYIIINGTTEGLYPPTIFESISAPSTINELPTKWCVKCYQGMNTTPELKEWRLGIGCCEWSNEGFINNKGMWTEDFYDTIIPYDMFVEKVYKPWKASSVKPAVPEQKPLPIKVVGAKYRVIEGNKYYQSGDIITLHRDDSSSAPEFTHPKKGPRYFCLSSLEGPLPPESSGIMVTTVDEGAKVVRGRDWDWGDQGLNCIGTIIGGKGAKGWVRVKWTNGTENCYRIGNQNKYDLYYAEGYIPKESKTEPKTVTSLPEKWIVSLKDVTDEQLGRANTWRKYVTNKCYLSYTLHKTYNLCNHEDGSMFYTGTINSYVDSRENVVEISFQDFERFVLKPWESSVVTSIGGTINAIPGTPSPDGSSVSYKYTINSPDSIPNLVIKKQKKIKLLSTEVEDFNVNLSLNIKNQKKCQKQN